MAINHVTESHINMDKTMEPNAINNLKLEKERGYDGEISINLSKPCPRHHTIIKSRVVISRS